VIHATDQAQDRLRKVFNLNSFTFCDYPDEAAARLKERKFEAAFLALDGDLPAILAEVTALREKVPKLPLLVLYDHGQEELAAAVLRSGATGMLAWDLLNPESLAAADALFQGELSTQRSRAILETISQLAGEMMREPPWRQHISLFLESLGRAAQATRVSIFACFTTTEEQQAASMVYEWAAAGVQPRLMNPALQTIPLNGSTLPLLFQCLQTCQPVSALAADLSSADRALLGVNQHTALLAAPVFVSGIRWGLIYLEGGRSGSARPANEAAALQMAASLLGSAISLEQSQEDYRSILEHSLQGVMVFTGTNIVYANPQVQQWSGHTLEELRHLKLDWYIEHINPEDRDRLVDGMNLLENNQILALRQEFRVKIIDGRFHWFESLFNHSTYNGQAGMQALLMDITERKEAEERMKSQMRLNEMLSEVSSQLLNTDPLQFEIAVSSLATRLSARFGAEHVFIFLLSADGLWVEEILEWNNGLLSGWDHVPLPWNQAAWSWVTSKLQEQETFYIPDAGNLPAAAGKLDFDLENRGLRSVLLTRMTYNQRPVGVLAMATSQVSAGWREEEVSAFSLAGGMLAGVAARRQAEVALHLANERLEESVAELEKGNSTATQFIRMGNRLQACSTPQEVMSAVREFGPQVFPGSSGQVFFKPGGEDEPLVTTWGNCGTCLHMEEIEQIMSSLDQNDSVEAKQGYSPETGHWLCVPLISSWENHGMLCLINIDLSQIERIRHYAVLLSERITLTLTNLLLRAELRSQSIRDQLTGLFNRRYLEEALPSELEKATAENTSLSLMMVDLDFFKEVNDRFGHEAGDHVLRHIARFFQGHVRVTDVVCRYGGDEFIVILPGAGLEEALARAEEMRTGCGMLNILYNSQQINPVHISVGVAVYPLHGRTGQGLVRAADRGLYRAKDAGRDRVELAGQD